MKKFLKPLFYTTTVYSIIALPAFAEKTGGACNAGAALFGIGLFLIISGILTFLAIRNSSKKRGRICSILALFTWGFWMVGVCIDSPTIGLIYFSPLFITILVTAYYSFGEKRIMRLFNLFKSKPKFRDELFGEMDYTRFKDPKKNFYSGTVNFNSLAIGITIDADENGPTREQRDFFLNLMNNYSFIQKNKIEPFLKIELESWIEESRIMNFETEFILDGISIPILPATPVLWSITYDAKKINHWVTIDFRDFEPRGMRVDG